MPSDEQMVMRARQAGDLSTDESFRALYDLYGREVLSWLSVRTREEADDLFQDVWSAFYFRWQRWEVREDLMAAEARPVLSFLFRTAALTWRQRFNRRRPAEPVDDLDIEDAGSGPEAVHRRLQLGDTLALASRICPPEELDVLMARLSGLSGAEIADALGITPATADHRYRDCVIRLRRKLRPQEVNS